MFVFFVKLEKIIQERNFLILKISGSSNLPQQQQMLQNGPFIPGSPNLQQQQQLLQNNLFIPVSGARVNTPSKQSDCAFQSQTVPQNLAQNNLQQQQQLLQNSLFAPGTGVNTPPKQGDSTFQPQTVPQNLTSSNIQTTNINSLFMQTNVVQNDVPPPSYVHSFFAPQQSPTARNQFVTTKTTTAIITDMNLKKTPDDTSVKKQT